MGEESWSEKGAECERKNLSNSKVGKEREIEWE